jgi:hypothetical protein
MVARRNLSVSIFCQRLFWLDSQDIAKDILIIHSYPYLDKKGIDTVCECRKEVVA